MPANPPAPVADQPHVEAMSPEEIAEARQAQSALQIVAAGLRRAEQPLSAGAIEPAADVMYRLLEIAADHVRLRDQLERVTREGLDEAGPLELVDEALSAKREAEARLAAVQEGWRLVPVEPTPEMCQAAHDGPIGADEHLMDKSQRDWLRDIWSVMLAAAPPAAKEG